MDDYSFKETFDRHRSHVDKRFDRLEDLVREHEHRDKVSWYAFASILATFLLFAAGMVIV
jgi:hypothetical protein